MPETSKMQFKIEIPGQEAKPVTIRPLTQKQVITYLQGMHLEERVREELIQRISRFPANSLNVAMRNVQNMIAEINKKFTEMEEENASQENQGT